MYLALLILGNVFILLFLIYYYKDLLHPSVIFCLPWLIFSFLLLVSNFDYNAMSYCYLFYLFGTILFVLGGCLGSRGANPNDRLVEKDNVTYIIKMRNLKVGVFIELVFTIFVLLSYWVFIIQNYAGNIFLSYYINKDRFWAQGIVGYGRNIAMAFGLCLFIGYVSINGKDKKNYKKLMVVQLILYVVLSLTRMTRNGILFAFLPLIMVGLIVFKQNNKQIFIKIAIAVLAFLFLFAIVAILKFPYLFSEGHYLEEILNQIVVYGTGSLVAFQKTFDLMDFPNYNGRNTFRFIFAFIDKIFRTNFAPILTQDFIEIGEDAVTNVYTYYQYYACDWGPMFALITQFFVGFFHGAFYKKMTRLKMFGIYIYCIFTYPLVMQFFQDQYVSLTSSWIQLLIMGFLFLKTDLLFKHNPEKGNM